MKQQQKSYWCGPAAIQNALRCLGKKVSQRKIAELCGTTTEGTTEYQVMAGIDLLGRTYFGLNSDSQIDARRFLTEHSVFLVCVDQWQHWVTVLPTRARFILIDPARTKNNLADHLTHSVSWRQLEKRWRVAARKQTDPGDRTYYALAIH